MRVYGTEIGQFTLRGLSVGGLPVHALHGNGSRRACLVPSVARLLTHLTTQHVFVSH